MDYEILLEQAMELGYRLQICGAETFRVEETIRRILTAYRCDTEVFCIPNCIMVSCRTPEGHDLSRMRRVDGVSMDLDGIERYSNLSRQICAGTPETKLFQDLLDQGVRDTRTYSFPAMLAAYFFATGGYAVLFNGTLADGLCAGLCGIVAGTCLMALAALKVNKFFSTITTAFFLSLASYFFVRVGWADSVDAITIGALMTLVPGILFTNAIRDIIFGDTNSGVNRLVQVLLIAVGIAVGNGTAFSLAWSLWGELPATAALAPHNSVISALACFVGTTGFGYIFNIHGPGMLLCSLGGVLAWLVQYLTQAAGLSLLWSYFIAAVVLSSYAEIMARIRKYPASSYLSAALFPLVPGAGIYYTIDYLIRGNGAAFSSKGLETAGAAGCLAVGVLLVSTAFRAWGTWQQRK